MRSSFVLFRLVLSCFCVLFLLWGCSSKEVQPLPHTPQEPTAPQEPGLPQEPPTPTPETPKPSEPSPTDAYQAPEFEDLSNQFDASPAWPLCGRITDNSPQGWSAAEGCPAERWGSANYTDAPIASTFGPRPLVSDNDRYDFHRGLDLAAPVGTPVFAISAGTVQIAGKNPSYSDPLVQLRHSRPNETNCQNKGCYHSNYMHLSSWVVTKGDTVNKGQLIGYVGKSKSGYAHLHFEIRNAPGAHDPYSTWQRDAIHPLSVLTHPQSSAASNIQLSFSELDLTDPTNPKPTLSLNLPSGNELDLRRIELAAYTQKGQTYQLQAGDTRVGKSPEGTGYLVNPSWFDLSDMNRMYSYKNSSSFPWASFECGGAFASPYCETLPESYNANVHMDAQSETDSQVGEFNGLSIWPSPHNNNSTSYTLKLRFNALRTSTSEGLCLRARALDAKGNATSWLNKGDCSNLP